MCRDWSVLCLNFPRFACPTRRPSSCALAGHPPEGQVPSGLLTSHRQLLAGTEADRRGSGSGEPAPKLWLMVGPLHPTQKRELAAFVLPKSKGELIFAPEMANLVRGSFLSQCPPAPAPARLRAGPLPGGPASRPPSQGGVGKGRARGEEQEEVGKKGDPVVFSRREGSFGAQSPSSSLQPNPLPGLRSNFPSPWPG